MATTAPTPPAAETAGFDLSRALAAYLDRFSRAAITTALAPASRDSRPPADARKPA